MSAAPLSDRRPFVPRRGASRPGSASRLGSHTLLERALIALGVFALGFFVPGFLGNTLEAQQFREVEKRHLRHILTRSEEQVEKIIAEYKAGAKFNVLARKYSYDPVTKRIGGDLGWVTRGTYEFDNEAFAIPKPGDVAKGKSRYGWHVLLLEEVKVEKVPVRPDAVQPRPTNPPVQPKVSRPDKNVAVTLKFDKMAHQPGEDVFFSITMRNNTLVDKETEPKDVDVFDPSLWPYGLTVRYEKGRLNSSLTFENADQAPGDGYVFSLAPGESRTERYRLQDYGGELGNWPIIRVNWRGNIFMQRVASLHKEYAQQAEYETLRQSWRYYYTDESHINILPKFNPSERWYGLVDISGGTVWVELKDPAGAAIVGPWIEHVRNEVYDKAPLTDYQEGSHVVGGHGLVKMIGNLPPDWTGKVGPLQRGDLALSVGGQVPRQYVGSGLYVGLGDASALSGKVVPIGKIVLGQRTLERLEARYAENPGRAKKLSISRVDIYPESILPESVLNAIERERNESGGQGQPTTQPAKPATKPANAKLEPAKAATGELPRVRVKTARGAFVIELFEDDAPNTVAHFLSLVERGFYDGSKLDREDWATGILQGGAPADGNELKYSVPDEISKLRHQKSYVGLARRRDQKDSGGSRFYMCLRPIPSLDGSWTIFGRIIEGFSTAASMKKGDAFLEMKVLRKRDHGYSFTRISRQK